MTRAKDRPTHTFQSAPKLRIPTAKIDEVHALLRDTAMSFTAIAKTAGVAYETVVRVADLRRTRMPAAIAAPVDDEATAAMKRVRSCADHLADLWREHPPSAAARALAHIHAGATDGR